MGAPKENKCHKKKPIKEDKAGPSSSTASSSANQEKLMIQKYQAKISEMLKDTEAQKKAVLILQELMNQQGKKKF